MFLWPNSQHSLSKVVVDQEAPVIVSFYLTVPFTYWAVEKPEVLRFVHQSEKIQIVFGNRPINAAHSNSEM